MRDFRSVTSAQSITPRDSITLELGVGTTIVPFDILSSKVNMCQHL